MSTSSETQAPRTVQGYRHGRVPREVRAQQLLDIAAALMIEHGYDAFSIEDLCRAAGISRPIVYEHFGSKEGIFIAYIKSIWQLYDDALNAASTGEFDTVEQIVEAGSEAFYIALEGNPEAWRLAYSAGAFGGAIAEQFDELRGATIDRIVALARLLSPETDDQQLKALAQFISGAGEQLGRWWLKNPQIPRTTIVAYHRDFVLSMLRGLNEDRLR